MGKLEGKNIAITGASSGIGRVTAIRVAKGGGKGYSQKEEGTHGPFIPLPSPHMGRCNQPDLERLAGESELPMLKSTGFPLHRQ